MRGCGSPLRGAVWPRESALGGAGHHQHRRCRGQPCADAGRDRGLPEEAPGADLQDQLHQGARAGASGQAEGDAGGGPQRYRHGADRHRFSCCGHRAWRADKSAARIRGQIPESDGELSAGGCQDAGAGARLRRGGDVHAGGTAGRVQPRQGQAGADDAGRIAGLVQGQSEPPDLRPPGELRPGPNFHHGPALHPRRQGPQGPGERVGKNLGVSERPQQLHRVLPDRDRGGDEGAR